MKQFRVVLALAATLAAVPLSAHASAPRASIPGLIKPGTLTFGTNFGYPPMEMYTGANVNIPTGADVEFAQQIARRLHLRVAFNNVTNFDTIVPGLQAHRYDVIISSMNVTPKRAKVVNFIKYMNVGQSMLVRAGNPSHIHTLSDLSGKRVAVQVGTTEADSITAENKILAAQHKPLIVVKVFPEDTTAVQQVAIGRFVADLEDYPVAVYNATKQAAIFQIAGQQFATAPYGMAFRKSDSALLAAVNTVFNAMRHDGTYLRILKKYGLTQAVLK